MRIIKGKEKEYKDWYDKNSDGYSRACFTYAERWAELLEAEIDKSNDVTECFADNADRLSREADTEGITKKYDYDGGGAVNPAVITVGAK